MLIFYPLDWSPACSDQLSLYQRQAQEFERLNAEVLVVSVDSLYSHGAGAAVRGLTSPRLAAEEVTMFTMPPTRSKDARNRPSVPVVVYRTNWFATAPWQVKWWMGGSFSHPAVQVGGQILV